MKMRVVPFILAVMAPVFIVIAWLSLGLPVLGHITGDMVAFCHSLFEMCAEHKAVAWLGMLALGAALVAGAFGYGLCRNLSRFFKAARAIKAMPKVDTGSSIVLIRDETSLSAFTWGLIAPRIYLSTGLLHALTREELRAVCLHEAAHRAGLDPLRFFLLNILSDIFVYIPLVRHFAAYLRAKKEFAADDYAMRRTGEAISLASALLKVSSCAVAAVPAPASFIGYGSVSERITRLFNINGQKGALSVRRVGLRSVVVSLCMTVFLALALAMPLIASPMSVEACVARHCSLHAHTNDAGRSCRTHCKTDKAGHHIH